VIRYCLRSLTKSEKGVSLIEFALVLPIILALLIGVIEFGWVLNGYITVTGAAREGARVAVVGDVENIDNAVESHLDYYLTKMTGLAITKDIGDFGEETSVIVSGNLSSLTGFIGGSGSIIPFPDIFPVSLSSEAVMRQEQDVNN
jgi:Flp pilus assembly protein TadG